MTYQETLNWMFSQLPMYQREGKTAFKKDLTNIIAFSKELEFPEKKFKSIHVGGTNGKGSTSHMIASVLQEAGYKVGLYTSPHLKNFTERIRINGEEVSQDFIIDFVERNKSFLEKQQLSFFEMTVGMAFDYFAKEKVDIAVVEVGLGGRLDSTNIITPEVSVITNIGLDHTQFLGETLPEIAFEKAGIIKKMIPIVIGEKQKEVESVFIKKANEMISELTSKVKTLEKNSKIDALTKIFNRRALDSYVSDICTNKDINYNLHVLMLDIDYFKKVNDKHGHIAGDKILIFISNILRKTLRDGDKIFRYGGEEFTIVLNRNSDEECELISKRLLSLISSNKLIYMGQKISVTVSIGATKLLKEDIPDSLLSRADKALYFSKHNGKNQASMVME